MLKFFLVFVLEAKTCQPTLAHPGPVLAQSWTKQREEEEEDEEEEDPLFSRVLDQALAGPALASPLWRWTKQRVKGYKSCRVPMKGAEAYTVSLSYTFQRNTHPTSQCTHEKIYIR